MSLEDTTTTDRKATSDRSFSVDGGVWMLRTFLFITAAAGFRQTVARCPVSCLTWQKRHEHLSCNVCRPAAHAGGQ